MDPATVLALVETCAGLAVTAGKLAVGLKSLASNCKNAALTFRSLSTQCKLFSCAVRALQQWIEDGPDHARLDDNTWEQLADSLECANDAIFALENELISTSGGTINTFWDKINVVWNQKTLKELEDCIHKQISSMSVILQIMSLPSGKVQQQGLRDHYSVFQESRTSALSTRDPESSTIRPTVAASTFGAGTISTSVSKLPRFEFDELLMASQVYLRNRNRPHLVHSVGTKRGSYRDVGVEANPWEVEQAPYTFPKDLLDSIDRNPSEAKSVLRGMWEEHKMLGV